MCENILQDVSNLSNMDLCKNDLPRIYHQRPRSETSVQGNPHQYLPCIQTGSLQNKARCKIFTNSYKNINMNKLIFSTFLYCPAIYPLPASGKKKPGKRSEGFSTTEAEKPCYTSLRVLSYSNRESDPALVPRKHPCHRRA